MGDQTGPFDWHLTHHLLRLAQEHDIPHQRDVFRYYRCDAASAIEAGNDIRTALMTFGIDGSHGYERVHLDALMQVARLLTVYVQSQPVIAARQEAPRRHRGLPRPPADPPHDLTPRRLYPAGCRCLRAGARRPSQQMAASTAA